MHEEVPERLRTALEKLPEEVRQSAAASPTPPRSEQLENSSTDASAVSAAPSILIVDDNTLNLRVGRSDMAVMNASLTGRIFLVAWSISQEAFLSVHRGNEWGRGS